MSHPVRYGIILSTILCFLGTVTLHAQSLSEIELKTGWEFARTDDTVWRSATVPGTVHTDLLQHGLIPDPFVGANEKAVQWVDKKDWQYRTTFQAPAALLQQEVIELDCRGLDTYAAIYVNGQEVLQTNNMFTSHRVNVKNRLRPGNNELRIVFYSPIKHDMPHFLQDAFIYPAGNDASDIPLSVYARKAPYHYGWDWGPRLVTAGIWRPIYLRAWNKAAICNVWLQQQSLTDQTAQLQANISLEAAATGKYSVQVESADKAFATITLPAALQQGNNALRIPFTIAHPQRWWPNGLGKAQLYTVKVSLLNEKQVLATQQVRIGLRTLQVVNEPDSLGQSFYVKVNGKPVFMKGANYIPQDNFLPRVTPAQYQRLFNSMQDAHFNMVRVWGGGIYEDDLFYNLADEKGILVWQDFMFACSFYPADTAFLEKVKAEATDNITRLRNHPSLALWCGNNEIAVAIKHWGWKDGYAYSDEQWRQLQQGYDRIFKELLPQQVAALDPGRFYFHSSPISNWGTPEDFTKGDNHYWGVWHGMEWFDAFLTHVPRFMSEYGFQSFPDIHTVRRFAGKKDEDIYSPVMLSHQKSAARGNTAINTYLLHYYKTPKDFESFLYVNQVLQAEGMKVGIEAHRRAMPFCMGTLYWQLNDCWPGPSWSGIDYYGRWKALHYYVKKAYSPLLVSNVMEKGALRTYVVSDEAQDQPLSLEMYLLDVDGKVHWQQQLQVTAKAGKSEVQHTIALAELLKGVDTARVICYTKLLKNNKLISDNIYYFVAAKDMELPAPDLRTSISAYTDSTLQIKITANKLARNVYLLLNNDPASFFSDNYFDLLPGQEKIITLQTTQSLQEVRTQLKVITLTDSYK